MIVFLQLKARKNLISCLLSNPFLKATNAEWPSAPCVGLQWGKPRMLINIPRGQLSPGYALRGIKLYMTEKENYW